MINSSLQTALKAQISMFNLAKTDQAMTILFIIKLLLAIYLSEFF